MNEPILVVDDEGDMVELLSFNLRRHGYSVETADNGLLALHKARYFHPRLVLLDLMMRGMDGYTVCEMLRQHSATASNPILRTIPTSERSCRPDETG